MRCELSGAGSVPTTAITFMLLGVHTANFEHNTFSIVLLPTLNIAVHGAPSVCGQKPLPTHSYSMKARMLGVLTLDARIDLTLSNPVLGGWQTFPPKAPSSGTATALLKMTSAGSISHRQRA